MHHLLCVSVCCDITDMNTAITGFCLFVLVPLIYAHVNKVIAKRGGGVLPPPFRDVFPVSCQRCAGTACLHSDAPARFQSSRFSVKQFDRNKQRFVDLLFLLYRRRFGKHWSRNGREHRGV